MRSLTKAAAVLALAAVLVAAVLSLDSGAAGIKPAGFELPHQTLNKAAVTPYGPTTGCTAGQTRPRPRGTNIVSEANVGCYDQAGYKIVAVRLVRRLYARSPYVRRWHVYSRQATVTSRRWEGSLYSLLSDRCGAGEGWYWYEVRQVIRVEWSHPTTGDSGVARLSSRIRSNGTLNCGGYE